MDDYRVYKPDRWETALGVLLLAGFLILIGILFYDTPLTVVLTVILIRPALRVYSGVMAEKRLNKLKLEFRDLLDSLAASFAGGRHMREALQEAESELGNIYEADDDIMMEIRGMLKRIDEGETDAAVIDSFAERTNIEDIRMFSQVFSTCRETGGDIITAITEASSMLGDKIKIENEIRALTSQKKSEGMVISVMPVIIIIFLRMIAPDYVKVLYGNVLGIVLMTAALGATVFAFSMIRKITAIEV